MNRWVGAAVFVLLSPCGACSAVDSPQGSTAVVEAAIDSPSYPSVVALNENSDSTVVGTVGQLIGREVDDGGNSEDSGGTPMAIYAVSVQRVLRGSAPDEIAIAWLDASNVKAEPAVSKMVTGQQVVLWLDHLSAVEAPGIDLVDEVWVPIGGDNGVMDLEGQVATARSVHLVAWDVDAGSGPLKATITELARAMTP